MNYALLHQIVEDAVERLVAAGVSRSVAERSMKGVEWDSVQDITENNRDDQLLLNLERYGSKALAERHGVSDRTIRDWRQAALNRKFGRRPAAA